MATLSLQEQLKPVKAAIANRATTEQQQEKEYLEENNLPYDDSLQWDENTPPSELQRLYKLAKLRHAVVLADHGAISSQIRAAQQKQHKTGEYADEVWFIRVMDAKRHKGRDAQTLQNLAAEIKKQISQVNNIEVCRVFVDIMKDRLTGTEFKEVMAEAVAIMEG
jgi:hypothetical protein